MKYFSFFVLFMIGISISSRGQLGFFEKSLEPDYDVTINAIVHDSSGTFYAAGGGAFGFLRKGWFIKIDPNGTVQHIPLIERDDNYLNDIIPTIDNNFLICGYSSYCDIVPADVGIIYKMAPGGNIIWAKEVNPDSSFNYTDNKLQQIFELKSGKI